MPHTNEEAMSAADFGHLSGKETVDLLKMEEAEGDGPMQRESMNALRERLDELESSEISAADFDGVPRAQALELLAMEQQEPKNPTREAIITALEQYIEGLNQELN